MKAARFYGPKDIRVEEVQEPKVGHGQVKLKIAWCGVCGTDLHEYLVGPIVCPSTPHPTTGEKLPITLGHEFSGTIVAVGPGVDKNEYAVGNNAIVEPTLGCKSPECEVCPAGLPNLCETLGVIGLSGGGGGLSGYVAVDTKYVHVIPQNIPLDVAACIEPLAVAWHAIKRSTFKPGDSCVIIGSGPIGLFCLKVLKALGCGFIVVSEPAKGRREKSVQVGADLALDPLNTDVIQVIKDRTKGRGVDVAFECSGSEAGLLTAITVIKPRGMVMNISIYEKKPALDLNPLVLKEKTVTGSSAYIGVHKEVIAAISSGKLKGIEDLITMKLPISNVVDKGFDALINEKDTQIKILFHPEHPETV